MKLLQRILLRLFPRSGVFYIGGADTMPPPLSRAEEAAALQALAEGDEDARAKLIEHNLRLVVFLARRFENTGVNIEDLISIGTIGLIKALGTFRADKNIKLATYASRCIENEILMYLRKLAVRRGEVSIDEPLNTDWDGNELLLSDILGTDPDEVSKPLEADADRAMLRAALASLPPREREIICLRFGIGQTAGGHAKRGGRRHGHQPELHQPTGKAHHREAERGDGAADAVDCQTKAFPSGEGGPRLRGG